MCVVTGAGTIIERVSDCCWMPNKFFFVFR